MNPELPTDPEWDEATYDALADIWVQITPEERDVVEAAVRRLNRLLRDDPDIQGESRTGRIRVTFEGPLTVYFRYVPGHLARVLNVRHFRPRGR